MGRGALNMSGRKRGVVPMRVGTGYTRTEKDVSGTGVMIYA
jgi:hypothetical protein